MWIMLEEEMAVQCFNLSKVVIGLLTLLEIFGGGSSSSHSVSVYLMVSWNGASELVSVIIG